MTPHFFPRKMLIKIIFTKKESLKKFHRGKIEIFKKNGKLMANICHSLDALLP